MSLRTTPLLLLASLARSQANLQPGREPILGYNSYNDIACDANSTYMDATIRALDATGLKDLGYKYFQIDCGWQAFERLSNGSITYDETRFPDGILPVSELARSLGFKFSMYTDQGVRSCDTTPGGRIGSLGHEQEDAERFAYWGAEYVKVDNCYITADQNAPKDPRTDFPSRFGAMWTALQDVGIEEMLVCQWGTPYINQSGGYETLEGPAEWTPPISTSFRVSDDIAGAWANVVRIANENIHVVLRGDAGPGQWSDMDLLEVGNNGLTLVEQRSHFALWAMSKSTLMISTNIQDMSDETFEIFSNERLLAVNQDDLGEPVKLVQRYSNDHDVYAGPLAGGDEAVLLLSSKDATNTLAVDFERLGIHHADVTDLWTGKVQRKARKFSATVAAHGNVALRLSNIKRDHGSRHRPEQRFIYYEAEVGTVSGGANVQDCRGCSNGTKVGFLSSNSSVTISGIRTHEETQNVRFDYVNCDVGYLSDQKPNYRTAAITVNGGAPQLVDFPLTGYEWTLDVLEGFLVRLSGFDVHGDNTIVISGPPADAVADSNAGTYGPDIDRVGIVEKAWGRW
ncbi:hypothetical protein B0A50_02404 [Salinomyces thailandicus]|uniref:Alpha-galactosidase n=1 Tax=Salinomyces thailandicus TaxID=706561 RepID=A0A4U0U6S4_9PEZI|nr:hypothetical protein B0A50_02404 [Salinomyces thailandica]